MYLEGDTLFANRGEFGAAFGDDLVFVLYGLLLLVYGWV